MNEQVETLEFQAEARRLLQLVIHSIYSNKDIFLRELISNAADALDKVRLATFADKDLEADVSDLHVEIAVDPTERSLTVRDNGIGMTREEVVELIGTIARSGTAELLQRLKDSKEAASPDLIGQFGVGFYSTFMVADRVTLVTRRAGLTEGVRWSSDGQGSYTIEPAPDAPQGTTVTVHLKEPDEEDQLFDYTAEWKVREIVKRYSDFIPWPITMEREGKPETLNSMKALWARPRSEVSDEEYHEFYKHLTHDWTDPLDTVHMRAEGTFEYEALLFIPARAPLDLFQVDGQRGIQLYVKRVFIMDDCEALVPSYLRFVKGVVDAHDLSLNVSREILQQDRQIQIIRRRLVRKLLTTLKEMDAQKYLTFWEQFGRVVKEGLLNDSDNRESILDIARFASTQVPAALTSLRQYVERMKEHQEHIYFMTGESRATIEHSPHLEAFQAKGYEVLLLTDPVDEVWVDVVHEFDGKPLQSIAKGQVDLDSEEEKQTAESGREQHPPDLDGRHPDRAGQGGPPVVPADHLAGLHRGRRGRRHAGPGPDVPGDGPATAGPEADPRAEPGPPAGDRAPAGPRGPPRRRAAGRDGRAALRDRGAGRGQRAGRPGPVRPAADQPARAQPLTVHDGLSALEARPRSR
jgi:molecular chaperone HtpG